jgi:hypothetical protein
MIAVRELPLLTTLLAACHHAAPTLPPEDARALAQATTEGELVYRGAVHPTELVYERRVQRSGDDWISSHVTMRNNGEPILLQRAVHSPAYALRRLDAIQGQTGDVGRVIVDGDRVELSTRSGRRRVEHTDLPVVVGPTLFGFVLQHLDALLAGEAIAIRFAAVERARTYGFTLRRIASDDGVTKIELRADSWVVRTSIAPMTITFDAATRRVVRYEGRVPPLRDDGRPLDARVEYDFVASSYR